MNSGLWRLTYRSSNAIRGDDGTVQSELSKILDQSRANNTSFGLTGALFYEHGSFTQIIEGPLAAIETTYDRISLDLRHKDLMIIELAPIGKLLFYGWPMALIVGGQTENNLNSEIVAATQRDLTGLPGQMIAELFYRIVAEQHAVAA